ncbi:hypothetical protein BO71DRAFT_430825 [Aspergillus ellipticus CBS 707.79]|uniref:Uncharacterized protein n=1 Tax=Aspergillus ellipticus CBS 707.79 TaxID=1448320 RepID=A0A319D8G4_9EURO|nr:hypothetical protein BO71DRAFT_430825 [Aspergillus ellipticus CBS 707.79]
MWDEDRDDTLECWSHVLQPETIKITTGVVQSLPVRNKVRCLSGIMAARMNPWLALLVFHTPNTEDLGLVVGEEGLSFLDPLFPLFQPEPPGVLALLFLSKLKALYIKDQGPCLGPMENLNYLLQLPQLETFSMAYCSGDFSNCPSFDIASKTLGVTWLSLYQANLDRERLTKLVSACKCLKEFVCRTEEDNDYSEDCCQFEASDLLKILDSQKDSLEAIHIQLGLSDPSFLPWDECPQYGSFKKFTRLRHLEADQGLVQNVTAARVS